MTSLNWQKSSFSSEASNCLEIAAAAGGAPELRIHLRESDEPELALVTSPAYLGGLLRAVKSGALRGVGACRLP